ncbi:MAG: hypothetical protein SH809_15440, partial [Rhodothermales bacterium]|nr:hypothetical protein [Rhodothermales bacterium]
TEQATEQLTEQATEQPSDNVTNYFSDNVTELLTEDAIEQSSDNVTEYFSDDVSEQFAEHATEQLSEDEAIAAGEMAASSPGATANGPAAQREPDAGDEELDRLIADLESARIVPRPDYETIEGPSLSAPVDDMVSETLARIYEGQKQYDEAARMYDKLAILKPDRADVFAQKAVELRTRAHSK